jgi:chromosomal replication initiator protein
MRKPARARTTGQDQTMDDKEIVAAILANLTERIGSDRFDVWFGDKVRLVSGRSNLTVEVPSQFHQNWLRRNFRGDLEAACLEVLGRPIGIEFRVVGALGAQSKRPREHIDDRQRQFDFLADPPDVSPSHTTATLVLDPPKRSKHSPPAAAPRRTFASLESFVVGSSNQLAHAVAKMIAEQPGRTNPCFFHGPTGVGKTHLLEGIVSESRRRHANINAVLLTAEQFTTGFLEALHGGGLPSFRHKYRGVNLFVLDDLQFIAGKRATVNEFLQTVDSLVRQGRQLVVAADRPPGELVELGSELTTRLSAGMVARIAPADHATREGIISAQAESLGLEINPEVRHFLASSFTAHAREITGAIHQLLAASRIRREPITRAIAEETLGELLQHKAQPVEFQEIEKAVCEVFGIKQQSLQCGQRLKSLNEPRMIAMWLARKHTRAALTEIGRYFGRRSHSTVISADKAVGKWMAERALLRMGNKTCNAEEAIRQVEARLRAS